MEELEKKTAAEAPPPAQPPSAEESLPAQGSEPAAAPAEGRRLAAPKGPGKKPLIACGVAAAVLAGGYVGLCAYASGDRVLPGVTVAGTDLSGMSSAAVRQALEDLSGQRYENLTIPLVLGEKRVELSAKEAAVTLNIDATAQLAEETGKGSFLSGGANFLKGLVAETPLERVTTVIDEGYVSAKVTEAAGMVSRPMTETRWELEETEDSAKLVLYRGATGQSVDEDALRQKVLSALRRGDGEAIQVEVVTASPAQPDFKEMAAQVAREAENAVYDPESDEITPHVLGVAAAAEDLQKAYNGLQEGQSGEVELTVTQPEITTESLRIGLFRDVLGEAKSKVSGSANRVGNVKLASEACNGTILLPGERMSYNQTTGQRTWEKGYREAGAYVGGKTVNEVGGGVCQPSSTLYLATLYADLKTVERKNHMYVVGYMPNGMDATVNWPNLDFVFENSTEYPIKVEMVMNGNILTARILGTKTDGSYIKMSSEVVEYYSYETEYKAGESIPRGTTKVDQTPYTGLKSKCFKHYYDENDNLLWTELVSTDVYKKRNKIVLYNPLDGVEGVIPPVAGTTEEPTVNPSESAAPAPSDTPATSQTLASTNPPEAGENGTSTENPAGNEGVETTPKPAESTPPESEEPTPTPPAQGGGEEGLGIPTDDLVDTSLLGE